MDWLERLINFHKLNGLNLEKYPKIDESGQILLYYSLKKAVDSLGGFAAVSSKQGLWKDVVAKLKLPAFGFNKQPMEEVLSQTYKTVILPFEKFLAFLTYAGVTNGECRYKDCNLQASKKAFATNRKRKAVQQVTPKMETADGPVAHVSEYHLNSHKTSHKQALVSPPQSPVSAKRTRRRRSFKASVAESDASDFVDSDYDETPGTKKRRSPRKTQEAVPVPKRNLRVKAERPASAEPEQLRRSSRTIVAEPEPVVQATSDEEVTICEICELACPEGDDSLSCNECEGMFHRACIASSQLFIQPKPDSKTWFCSRCLVGSCEFAFEPGPMYTLGDFQDLAEDFRDDYLAKNTELTDLDDEEFENEIEKRFWESVGSAGDSITVEYGSDIHCSDMGSGFPVRAKDPYNRYSKDPWNLNNMPHHKDSLFHQIKSDISGMTVPWLYVGMMFSTFCWHSEDHYTYSVNYQHFGDTKTWYGIPGDDAEKFEAAMRDTVPELFEKQPNLLFQLVTMLSPEVLVAKGVRCYAIDQGPGEFVITFPKAYHAGFNHGFNCNEAVNFAPPDWLAYGEESVNTYQLYNRAPVFSHDSLLLRTAKVDLRPKTAQWLFPHIDKLVEKELAKRRAIRAKHPYLAIESIVSEVSEEEYQCSVCNSLPYLSRVTITRNVRPKPLSNRGRWRSRSPSAATTAVTPAVDENDYDDSINSDTDLAELVFGAPRSVDPSASAADAAKASAVSSNSLVVCDLHVPEKLPRGLTAKMQIMCSDDELRQIRTEVESRRNEYEESLVKSEPAVVRQDSMATTTV